jgi:hypothetical protein
MCYRLLYHQTQTRQILFSQKAVKNHTMLITENFLMQITCYVPTILTREHQPQTPRKNVHIPTINFQPPNGLALSCGMTNFRDATNGTSSTTKVLSFATSRCSPCKLHPAGNRQLECLVRL